MPEIQLQPTPERIPRDISYSDLAKSMKRAGFDVVKRGLQSANFVTGSAGWKIDAEGNAEFNNGTFRGTFNLGNSQITVSTVAEIQPAINTISAAGGGIVFLQEGTYVLTANITIPSNVHLQGVPGTIIDLDDAYQITSTGGNVYTTGTVAISNNSSSVVGTGTTFTSGMVGRYILLQDFWYEITAFTDTTHITINTAYPYVGTTLSGASYVISSIVDNVGISDMTVQNGDINGIQFSYANEVDIRNLTLLDITDGSNKSGLLVSNSSRIFIDNITTNNCDYGVGIINGRYGQMSNIKTSFSRVSGVSLITGCRNWSIRDVSSESTTTGAGLSLTDAALISIDSFMSNNTADQGIQLVSGCDDLSIINSSINTTGGSNSGINIAGTCSNIRIIGNSIINSTNYGINNAASTNTDVVIVGNYIYNNSSGGINDIGTRTVVRGNSGGSNGVIENPQTSRVTSQFDQTNDNTASPITGLSARLEAGRAYTFEVRLFVDCANTGGVKVGFSGTATATSFIASAILMDEALNTNVLVNRIATFGTTTGVTATTGGMISLRGTIVCNAAGTFIPYFSQNVSDPTASSVLVNSTMIVREIN